jgi:hypothetical protein
MAHHPVHLGDVVRCRFRSIFEFGGLEHCTVAHASVYEQIVRSDSPSIDKPRRGSVDELRKQRFHLTKPGIGWSGKDHRMGRTGAYIRDGEEKVHHWPA